MKRGVLLAMLVLGGCATVTDIEQTLPTMSVISGKKPDAYAQCLVQQLSSTRREIGRASCRERVYVLV